MFNLDMSGKLVIVTGASRGIGKAIAEEFASHGAEVCGTATSQDGAEQITKYLAGHGQGFVMNGLDNASVDAFFNSVEEKYARSPDVLINNAGITRDTLLMRMKDEDWNDVIQCNLTAQMRLAKLCSAKMMKKRSGVIISISSIVGETGNAGQCNYAAAKAGLIGFSKSLAKEIAARGVRVNCIAPGFVATDMTASLKPEQLKAWTDTIPLRRAASAADIAGAALFLASDMASYITGSVIDVNGGLYCN